MTMLDAPILRQRLQTMEAQLREQTLHRDEAHRQANDAQTAILQLQGAITVLRDLLTPQEVEEKAS